IDPRSSILDPRSSLCLLERLGGKYELFPRFVTARAGIAVASRIVKDFATIGLQGTKKRVRQLPDSQFLMYQVLDRRAAQGRIGPLLQGKAMHQLQRSLGLSVRIALLLERLTKP